MSKIRVPNSWAGLLQRKKGSLKRHTQPITCPRHRPALTLGWWSEGVRRELAPYHCTPHLLTTPLHLSPEVWRCSCLAFHLKSRLGGPPGQLLVFLHPILLGGEKVAPLGKREETLLLPMGAMGKLR